MKKLLSVVLVLLLAFTMTGCKSSDKEDVVKAANNFMKVLDDGKFEEAAKLCDSTVATRLQITNYRSNITKQYQSLVDMGGDKIKAGMENFVTQVEQAVIKSYKLNDDYDDKNKTVSVEVEVLDTTSMSGLQSSLSSKSNSLATTYIKSHANELQKIYRSQGMKAYQKVVFEGIADDMFKILKEDFLDKLNTKKETWTMTFDKKDDNWIVKKVDVK